MSFRMKTTHKTLEQYAPSPPKEKTIENKENGAKDPVKKPPINPQTNPNINRPKQGSSGGMAIRTVNSASADHM